jgi:TetR/AcrR family transcriptional regulator, cholesterol catabolism regulator
MTLSHYFMASSLTAVHPSPRVARPLGGCRARRKAEVRDRLFRAALELFGTRGFVATTVEDITGAADVAKGTFFNYFPTKEHLLTEFGELRLDIIRSARAEAGQGRLPLRDVLRRLMFHLMKDPGRSRAMARCMLLGALGNEPVAGMVQKTFAEGRTLLAQTMAIGQRRGEVRRDWPATDLARLFQQSYFGAIYIWVLYPALDIRRSLDTTFSLFWAGIAAPANSSNKRTP